MLRSMHFTVVGLGSALAMWAPAYYVMWYSDNTMTAPRFYGMVATTYTIGAVVSGKHSEDAFLAYNLFAGLIAHVIQRGLVHYEDDDDDEEFFSYAEIQKKERHTRAEAIRARGHDYQKSLLTHLYPFVVRNSSRKR